ncbi:hypothetical protein EI555_001392, partial [Monodon monoceros]
VLGRHWLASSQGLGWEMTGPVWQCPQRTRGGLGEGPAPESGWSRAKRQQLLFADPSSSLSPTRVTREDGDFALCFSPSVAAHVGLSALKSAVLSGLLTILNLGTFLSSELFKEQLTARCFCGVRKHITPPTSRGDVYLTCHGVRGGEQGCSHTEGFRPEKARSPAGNVGGEAPARHTCPGDGSGASTGPLGPLLFCPPAPFLSLHQDCSHLTPFSIPGSICWPGVSKKAFICTHVPSTGCCFSLPYGKTLSTFHTSKNLSFARKRGCYKKEPSIKFCFQRGGHDDGDGWRHQRGVPCAAWQA